MPRDALTRLESREQGERGVTESCSLASYSNGGDEGGNERGGKKTKDEEKEIRDKPWRKKSRWREKEGKRV